MSPLFVSMINKKEITRLAQERIEELGKDLFIVEINISPKNVINVELESTEGGVTIEDCVSVSRNIEHNLDRETQDFELHVSSAGLDKPLRVHQQYVKNIGREVKTKLNSGEKLQGLLVSVNEQGFEIEQKRKERLEGKKKKVEVIEIFPVAFEDEKETKIIISFK